MLRKLFSKEKIKKRLKKEVEITKKGIKETKKIMKKERNELIDQVSYVITPEKKEWDIIRKLQKSGKLPLLLYQVFVYTKKRQYERGVMEMEHIDNILEVKLYNFFPYSISPQYREDVKHYTCLNPREGRLHVLLKKGYSIEDLYGLLQYNLLHDYDIFIPPKYL